MHILGYYMDWKDRAFLEQLSEYQESRGKRNRRMVQRLRDLGMNLEYEELEQMSPRGVMSRLHIARLMVKHGYARSIGAAFERWLNPGKPAYVRRTKVSPFEIIQSISHLGGIPVLAHPRLSRRDDLIPELVKSGLKGIEIYHNTQSGGVRDHYRRMAARYGLLMTGGSDCHGEVKDKVLMGKMKVPASLLIELKRARDKAHIY